MFHKLILFLILCFTIGICQTYDITGTISSELEYIGIEGATISIQGSDIFQTTDSNGRFQLKLSMVHTNRQFFSNQGKKIAFTNNSIIVNGFDKAASYSLQVFALDGRCLYKNCGIAGNRIALPLTLKSSKTLLVSLFLGKETFIGKLVYDGKSFLFSEGKTSIKANINKQASTSLCKDTLVISHWHYRTVKLALPDYTSKIEKTLSLKKLYLTFQSERNRIKVNPCKVSVIDSELVVDSVRFTDSTINDIPVFGVNSRNSSQSYYKAENVRFSTDWAMSRNVSKKILFAEVYKRDNSRDTLYDEAYVKPTHQLPTLRIDSLNNFTNIHESTETHQRCSINKRSLSFTLKNNDSSICEDFNYQIIIYSDNYQVEYITRPMQSKMNSFESTFFNYPFDTSTQGHINIDSMQIRTITGGTIAVPDSLRSKFTSSELINQPDRFRSYLKRIKIICKFKGKYFNEDISTYNGGQGYSEQVSVTLDLNPPQYNFYPDSTSIKSHSFALDGDTLQLPYTFNLTPGKSSIAAGWGRTISKLELLVAKMPDSTKWDPLKRPLNITESYLRSLSNVSIPYPNVQNQDTLKNVLITLNQSSEILSGRYVVAIVTADNLENHDIARNNSDFVLLPWIGFSKVNFNPIHVYIKNDN